MPNLTINNQIIPWPFYHKVRTKLDGPDNGTYWTDRAFFKCRDKSNIVRYMSKGLKCGWLSQSTSEMDHNKNYMESWIKENIPKPAQARQPKLKKQTAKGKKAEVESISSLLEGML